MLDLINRIHSVHGAIYRLTINPDVYMFMIDNNIDLQNKIIDLIKKSLHIKTTWIEFKANLNDENKFFLIDMLLFITNSNTNSLYRLGLHNKPYIRIKNKNSGNYIYSDKNTNNSVFLCQDDYLKNDDGVIWANSYYSIKKGSLFETYMTKWNRPYIAGPSGSIILLHMLVFDILKMEKTHENKIKIFAIGIADYIPYSHTLTEILMSYSNELGIEYTLDMDPVVSAINILDKFVNINSFSIFIKEKYIQAKQDYMKIGNINSL